MQGEDIDFEFYFEGKKLALNTPLFELLRDAGGAA